jgi:hypothetical protein
MSVVYIDEATIVSNWIWEKIQGDAEAKPGGTLGVRKLFNTQVRGKDIYPCIVYQNQSPPQDIRGKGLAPIWVEGLWTIKAIGKTDNYDDLAPIVAAIHRLFDATGGPVTGGGYIIQCWRRSILQMAEQDEQSVNFRHYGGTYKIEAQQWAP